MELNFKYELSEIKGVTVGKEPDFKHERLTVIKYHKPFEKESMIKKDFPSCENYDLKAWEYCLKYKKAAKVFFLECFRLNISLLTRQLLFQFQRLHQHQ